jgi:hypothetical protein
MAAGIHCRILVTALCWSGGSDWLLHLSDVKLYEDRGRSLPLQSRGKVQSDSDRKETESFRVTVTTRSNEHLRLTVTIRSCEDFSVTVTINSLSRQCYRYVYWRLVSCELLKSLSECYPQCACRTLVCCKFRWGVQNCTIWSSLRLLDKVMTLGHT